MRVRTPSSNLGDRVRVGLCCLISVSLFVLPVMILTEGATEAQTTRVRSEVRDVRWAPPPFLSTPPLGRTGIAVEHSPTARGGRGRECPSPVGASPARSPWESHGSASSQRPIATPRGSVAGAREVVSSPRPTRR